MDQSQVAKVYAGALLEIGQEKKSSDELETELKSFVDSFREDKEIWAFLTSPRVPKANKVSAIEKATAGKASKEITSLLCLLLRNDRISYINEIYNQFRNLNDKVKGLIRAKVYTAAPLSNEDKEGIVSWFKSSLNSAVELDAITQPDLIGGVVIKFDDKIVDGSIKYKLKTIKEAISLHSNEKLISNKNTGAYYED
ncbi:MAG: ATP synthase F1 subunit delta [Leptospiraceae bacterium]|nr:ATP synthase F1 subunit delta [Leptospiraceae bacterium]